MSLTQPLVWLYPALIVGAGLPPPAAAVGVGLTALAAAVQMALEGTLSGPLHPGEPLGPSYSILLSIALAGLGMTAVRQLIALNADLHATGADLAVADERERLARELHDLLGWTLSLIAFKAELAGNRRCRLGNVVSRWRRFPSWSAASGEQQNLARAAGVQEAQPYETKRRSPCTPRGRT